MAIPSDRLFLQRTRIGSPMISIVAAATTTPVFTCQANKLYLIRKIICTNNQGAPIQLIFGYTNLAAAWVQVSLPFIAINALDNTWIEDEIPVFGNYQTGWQVDTTALTGWAGIIACRSSAAAAAPNNVLVQIELEEIE